MSPPVQASRAPAPLPAKLKSTPISLLAQADRTHTPFPPHVNRTTIPPVQAPRSLVPKPVRMRRSGAQDNPAPPVPPEASFEFTRWGVVHLMDRATRRASTAARNRIRDALRSDTPLSGVVIDNGREDSCFSPDREESPTSTRLRPFLGL